MGDVDIVFLGGSRLKKRLGIRLKDEIYEQRLVDYVVSHYGDVFCVSKGGLCEEIVLVERGITIPEYLGERDIFYLTDEEENDREINKYQSLDTIVKHILYESDGIKESSMGKAKTTIIIAPFGKKEIRSESIEYAREKSLNERLVLLSYDMFGRIKQQDEDEYNPDEKYNLSTLCFCYEKEQRINESKIRACVSQRETYDYLNEFYMPTHVLEMRSVFTDVVKAIAKSGLYQRMVLALVDYPDRLWELLYFADEIIVVSKEEEGGLLERGFLDYLEHIGIDKPEEKVVWKR